MRMLKLPDGRIRILVQGVSRAQVESVDASGDFLRARLSVLPEVLAPERSLEVEALIRNVRAFDGKGREPWARTFRRK